MISRLTALGEETGCTFLLLRHLNKATGGTPMYRGGGSIGIVGAARAGYLVARDPDDPDTRVLACVKSNLAREPESLTYRRQSAPGTDVARVVWTGTSVHDAAGLLRTAEGEGEEGTARTTAAQQRLTGYMTEQGGAPKPPTSCGPPGPTTSPSAPSAGPPTSSACTSSDGDSARVLFLDLRPHRSTIQATFGHPGQLSEAGRNGRNGGRNAHDSDTNTEATP